MCARLAVLQGVEYSNMLLLVDFAYDVPLTFQEALGSVGGYTLVRGGAAAVANSRRQQEQQAADSSANHVAHDSICSSSSSDVHPLRCQQQRQQYTACVMHFGLRGFCWFGCGLPLGEHLAVAITMHGGSADVDSLWSSVLQ
jgi:hypothetical protein